MAYTHITFAQLKTQLASRLEDANKTFWTDTELGIHIYEAMRTFGQLSAFWRERGSFNTVAATAFYDLPTQLATQLAYSVTDRDLIQSIQFALLESASSQASWVGTDMFTYDDVVRAIERRRNQFLSDTGCVLTRATFAITAGALTDGRYDLADNVIDIRRAAWLSSLSYYNELKREDEFALASYGQNINWTTAADPPQRYSVLSPPPITLQFAPPPSANGTLELVSVNTGATLNPAAGASILGVPDDCTPWIRWGALADLLGRDGQARDPSRAQYCEQRYQQGVQLTRMIPTVVNVELDDIPTTPSTLEELDSYIPNWQNKSGDAGVNSIISLQGLNLAWIYPVPSVVFAVVMDVARRAPVPAADGNNVQLGREQLDMILDYAEHLALFKVGGAEFAATKRQADNFLLQSITYNQRLSAAARYVIEPKESSQKEKSQRPRRIESDGLGAQPVETSNA